MINCIAPFGIYIYIYIYIYLIVQILFESIVSLMVDYHDYFVI